MPPAAWEVMSPWLRVVLVSVSTKPAVVDGPSNMIKIVLVRLDREQQTLDLHESDPISLVFDHSASFTSSPREDVRIIYAGRQLEDGSSTVRDNGIKDGSRLSIVLRLCGGKPVIYLYPPTALDVSVKLSLVPAWEYSAIYPLTMIKRVELAKGQIGQLIEWNVNASPSGLLRDKLSGREITYLFWEAECARCLAPHYSD